MEREKEAYEKEGKEWLPAEERNRLEMERQNAEAEEIFREELRKKCEKSGMDYEAEAEKHRLEAEKKKLASEAKQRAAEEKTALKEQKQKEKLERRLASMSPQELEKHNKKAEKEEARWLLEKAKGDAYYEKTQAQLAGN